MHGDFTRFTFDPLKHYSRVLKQQGRVDVDADWNELNAIFNRLDRTTCIDVIGRVGVPIHDPGFQVSFAAPNLVLSAGRIYVDGIQVELDSPLTMAPNPAPVAGRKDLVYLDVWDRHITAIEDPHIREVALGGPDTCTRVKTEFQVRIQAGIDAKATCANAPLPPPSNGRLTAQVVPTPPADDPCLLAPTGGFRGLENRLYRVEIHQGGALGTATFKWSRDNGSIVFAITEYPAGQPDRVRLTRLGRDQVLTFRRGDWVEVLNDDNELSFTHGTLARILDLDETKMELQLSANPPISTFDKHPKVRRWDQPSDAIPTAAGPFALEDGIQVLFSGAKEQIKTLGEADFGTTGSADHWNFYFQQVVGKPAPAPEDIGFVGPTRNALVTFSVWWAAMVAGGFGVAGDAASFRTGDYWAFAARTAAANGTGDIEGFTNALPQGIAQHFGALATVTWPAVVGGPPQIDLCAPPFPPLTELPPGGGTGSGNLLLL